MNMHVDDKRISPIQTNAGTHGLDSMLNPHVI